MTNELRDAEEVQEKAFRNEGTLVRCAMVIESLRAELAARPKGHPYMPECAGPIYCGCSEENK